MENRTSENVRLIPARAGNIGSTTVTRPQVTAHPRSRGEHSSYRYPSSVSDGSSPLARGTYIEVDPPHPAVRLIPARAGNIVTQVAQGLSPAAHPRSRGEHRARIDPDGTLFGSSPLARGTLLERVAALTADRLIPARAGNIHSRNRASRGHAAHPRSRGEHCSACPPGVCSFGSSPLARGT